MVVVTGWVLASLLGFLVQRSGLTLGVDRVLGAVFGLVRGAVIVGFIVMMGQAAKLQSEPWWDASLIMPLGEEMAAILSGYVETGRQVVQDSLPDT
jgi:membrane protein required for colicin V production